MCTQQIVFIIQLNFILLFINLYDLIQYLKRLKILIS